MTTPKRPDASEFVSSLDQMVKPRPDTETASVTSIERPRNSDGTQTVSALTSASAKTKRTRPERHRTFPGALAKATEATPDAKITVSLSAELVNELRNAVIYQQTQGHRVSMKSLIVDAVEPMLEELREEIGGSIPQRPAEYKKLMPGRPPGADDVD